jgi:hypothetical protein
MTSAAITRREETITRLRSQLSGIRNKAEEKAKSLQNMGVAAGSAYLVGKYLKQRAERREAAATIAGLDPMVTYSAALYIAGTMAGGRAGEVLESASLGVLTSYAFIKGRGIEAAAIPSTATPSTTTP